MSYRYLDDLSHSDRTRYTSKLTALSAGTCPYKIPAGSWIDDPTKWPGIEWPDVAYYLIETHRVCLREKVCEIDGVSRHTTSLSLAGSKQCVTSSPLTALTAFWRLMSFHPSGSTTHRTTTGLVCTKRTGLWLQHTVIAWLGKYSH